MLDKKLRVISLLEDAIKEMELLGQMSENIHRPDDFISSISGLTVFRACGMSLQYITESFVKIRNLCTKGFFDSYKSIPWPAVFGMRNFLSHEYGDADTIGIFNTVKKNIPELLTASRQILADVQTGKLEGFLGE